MNVLMTPQAKACALCGATDEPGEGWQCETDGCTDRLCGFCGKEIGRCPRHISDAVWLVPPVPQQPLDSALGCEGGR